MDAFICTTCGTQYAPTAKPPDACAICDEERQFVPPSGQAWTTLKRLERSHMPTFRDEAGLIGSGMRPALASTSARFWSGADKGTCHGPYQPGQR